MPSAEYQRAWKLRMSPEQKAARREYDRVRRMNLTQEQREKKRRQDSRYREGLSATQKAAKAERDRMRYLTMSAEAKAKRLAYQAQYRKKRRAADPIYTLRLRLRCMVRLSMVRQANIRGHNKHGKTLDYVGCSLPELKRHIENQFLAGMTWENRDRWDIDHVIPVAVFNHADDQERRVCHHFSNLRPLWSDSNRRKSDTLAIEDWHVVFSRAPQAHQQILLRLRPAEIAA
jgi:hypothetical protein